MNDTFDFVVVGGGTAGCRLAYTLSKAPSKPSVLLIETGGAPTGDTLLSPYDRFTPVFTRPDLDWGYVSTPQPQLNNRVIPYHRGKGLGGSSILNFMVYCCGSEEDFDRWADLVGDNTWDWEHAKEIFKKIENFHSSQEKPYPKYASPREQDHGQEGTIDVCLPPILEKGVDLYLDTAVEFGYSRNLDFNSGNPIGCGVIPASYYDGMRTTSANAHLPKAPKNLVVWEHRSVVRVIFEGRRAVGVELEDGQRVSTNKEVILTAGVFNSPKLLLLSGIGPVHELQKHDIDVIHELPGVGALIRDHPIVFINVEVDSVLSEKYAFEADLPGMEKARQRWATDKTGPLSHHNGSTWGAFLKLPALEESEEFKALEPSVREYMQKPTVPAFEMALNAPMLPPGHTLPPGSGYLSNVVALMNAQSCGNLTLASANPKDAPVIDIAYMTHAFDRKAMLEAIKETMEFSERGLGELFKGYILGPRSHSDKDIEEFIKDQVAPLWHANGTVLMGRPDDINACVDSNLRVYGTTHLRVADLSICPLTVNAHTQSTAYLIGEKAAVSIIEEWKL